MPAPVPCWLPEGHEPGIWALASVLCRVGPEEVLRGLILAHLRGAWSRCCASLAVLCSQFQPGGTKGSVSAEAVSCSMPTGEGEVPWCCASPGSAAEPAAPPAAGLKLLAGGRENPSGAWLPASGWPGSSIKQLDGPGVLRGHHSSCGAPRAASLRGGHKAPCRAMPRALVCAHRVL